MQYHFLYFMVSLIMPFKIALLGKTDTSAQNKELWQAKTLCKYSIFNCNIYHNSINVANAFFIN